MDIFSGYRFAQNLVSDRSGYVHIRDYALIANNTRKAYIKG